MKNIFIFINLIILNILLNNIHSYLIFPFKTRESQINDTDKDITLLFRSLLYNHIYINLEIGEPKQTIEAFLSLDSTDFYISEKTKNDIKTNCSQPKMHDVGSDLSKFFDKDKSTSLNITSQTKYQYIGNIGNIASDYLYFTTNTNENFKNAFKFVLYNSTMGNRPAVIGLQFIRSQNDKENNLIDKLKLNDIINSYYWMINYTSEFEGNFIIGELPHIFDPSNFKEEELFTAHPFVYTAMSEKWGLRYDEITFNGKNFRPYHECYFEYEYNYIGGINKLEKELDIYFNESILNGTCFKKDIKYPYSPHIFFYCDKDKYIENIKYFPKIEFYHSEINYTFVMDYKDLFIEKHDKLILLIFFESYGSNWILGKPFLKKYQFLMNQDSKMVGFYIKKDKESTIDNNNNDNMSITIKIILIIIGIIILFVLGILISKFYFGNKKKRINILDEDYDYTSKEDEINKNIN